MTIWPDDADATVLWTRRGPYRDPDRIDAPLTRLSGDAVQALGAFRELVRISLRGEHFPTSTIGAGDIAAVGGVAVRELRLHGAYLTEADIVSLIRSLPHLRALDLAGVDLTLAGLASLLPILEGVDALDLGYAPPQAGKHRFTPTLRIVGVPDVLKPLGGLQRLSLRGLSIGDEVAELVSLAGLVTLDLGETAISDVTARALGTCGRLESLSVDQTALTDTGCSALAGASRLSRLDLSQTQASARTLAALRTLTDLQDINLSKTPFTNTSAPDLGKMPNLRRLDLSSTKADGTTIRNLADLTHLQHLDMSGCLIDAEALGPLAKLPGLQSLAISCREPPWTAITSLTALKVLTAPLLDLTEIPPQLVRLSGLSPLPGTADLATAERLELLAIPAGATHLKQMPDAALPRLREFACQNADVTDDVLATLARCPGLEALYVSGNRFTDAGLANLHGAPYVHTLELRDIRLGAEVISILTSLPRLHCLDVPGTGLIDRDVAGLAAAPNLQSLALDPSQITALSAGALATCKLLVELSIYKRGLKPETLGLLSGLSELEELNLMEEPLTIGLAEPIAHLAKLRLLRTWGGRDAVAAARLVEMRPDVRLEPAVAAFAVKPATRAFPHLPVDP